MQIQLRRQIGGIGWQIEALVHQIEHLLVAAGLVEGFQHQCRAGRWRCRRGWRLRRRRVQVEQVLVDFEQLIRQTDVPKHTTITSDNPKKTKYTRTETEHVELRIKILKAEKKFDENYANLGIGTGKATASQPEVIASISAWHVSSILQLLPAAVHHFAGQLLSQLRPLSLKEQSNCKKNCKR